MAKPTIIGIGSRKQTSREAQRELFDGLMEESEEVRIFNSNTRMQIAGADDKGEEDGAGSSA